MNDSSPVSPAYRSNFLLVILVPSADFFPNLYCLEKLVAFILVALLSSFVSVNENCKLCKNKTGLYLAFNKENWEPFKTNKAMPKWMKKFWTRFRNDFSMNSITEVYFWKSQWERFSPEDDKELVSLPFFAFRAGCFLWFLGTYIQFFTCGIDDTLFLIWLTNQTYTLQLGYNSLFFFYISWVLIKQRTAKRQTAVSAQEESPSHRISSISNDATGESIAVHPSGASFDQDNAHAQRGMLPAAPAVRIDRRPPLVAKIIWAIANIVYVVPYVITFMYWAFLRTSEYDGPCHIARDVFFHAFNTIVAMLDAMIIAFPIRPTHFVFPMVDGLFYSFFSGTYELSHFPLPGNDTSIYKILTWREEIGLSIVKCIAVTTMGGVFHFVLGYCLYRLRVLLSRLCNRGPRTSLVSVVIDESEPVQDEEQPEEHRTNHNQIPHDEKLHVSYGEDNRSHNSDDYGDAELGLGKKLGSPASPGQTKRKSKLQLKRKVSIRKSRSSHGNLSKRSSQTLRI